MNNRRLFLPAGVPALCVTMILSLAAARAQPPAETKASASQKRKSLNNLKQILLAMHNYHDAMGKMPADVYSKDGKPLLSWRVAILPYLEQDNVYRQFKMDEPWDSEHNKKLLAQVPAQYQVGIEPKGSTDTWYQGFDGPDTPLHPVMQGGKLRAINLAQMPDGTSNTIGVIEAGVPVPWTKPADILFDPKKPVKLTKPFSNQIHLAMMDGSAWALKPDIDPDILRRLIGMSDGEVTPNLDTLKALSPAESAEEKAELQKTIAENQKKIEQVEKLMKEHGQLLKEANKKITTADEAEFQSKRLDQLIEGITGANARLRGEPEPPDTIRRKPVTAEASPPPPPRPAPPKP